jgi:hypothetical protein
MTDGDLGLEFARERVEISGANGDRPELPGERFSGMPANDLRTESVHPSELHSLGELSRGDENLVP